MRAFVRRFSLSRSFLALRHAQIAAWHASFRNEIRRR
jgi:hypothetical protein